MNKIGHPNYLNNDMDSLIVSAAEIESGHDIPMKINYLLRD